MPELVLPTSVLFVWAGWSSPALDRSTPRLLQRCKLPRKHSKASVTLSSPYASLHFERDFALDVFSRLHVLEMKPGFVKTMARRSEDGISYMAKFMLGLPIRRRRII
jgi:hypothetical protein